MSVGIGSSPAEPAATARLVSHGAGRLSSSAARPGRPTSGIEPFVNARRLMGRHPPSLYQTVVTEFMRQGYFAPHVRRMRLLYRDQRAALVTELRRRASAAVRVDVPEHGMHLVASLADGLSDIDLERAAHERGIIVRAISRLYRKAPPRSALMLGFTGYPRDMIVPAAARLAEIINERPTASTGAGA